MAKAKIISSASKRIKKSADTNNPKPKRRPQNARQLNTVPKLPEVAPELKDHIIHHTGIKSDYGYWQSLAWIGVWLLGILVSTGSIIWLIELKQTPIKPTHKVKAATEVSQLTSISPLTGLPTSSATTNRRPWAVVVENFFTVRPQAGLGTADIIFESPTEGGITRLVAIYQSQLPPMVGPIRSARSYFNDWIRPLSPFYSHSGGSDRALRQLSSGYGGIVDINEFFHGAAYTRNSNFRAPHNLFTTPEKFLGYLENKKYNLSTNIPKMNFTTTLEPAPSVHNFTIPYKPPEYEVTYIYQPSQNNYQRLVDGTTQVDANTNQVLTVKNVVVIFTDITPIPNDPLLRVELRTLGTGKAQVYTGGRMYEGNWHKDTPDSMIELVDNNGAPLPLQPGNTWFSVVDSSTVIASASTNNQPLSF